MSFIYRNCAWPLLKRTNPEWIHDVTVDFLERTQTSTLGRKLIQGLAGTLPPLPVEVFGLTFPNPLGVAAGFDKDCRVAPGLALLGFGHVEVGTITPRPQAGNPIPRIFRLPADQAIINRMGFPNHGAEASVERLRGGSPAGRIFILGVSLGKQKDTPLEEAAQDYSRVLGAVFPYADYAAINVSSPNTPGLRELQGVAFLEGLLAQIQEENRRAGARHRSPPLPLLLKVAPDLSLDDLDAILGAAQECGIAGIIATNTTIARDGLRDPRQAEAGGLSGRPLKQRSTEVIRHISQATAGQLPIIGAGGVFTVDDVKEKLDAGASLVQIYTALAYEGPGLPGRLLRGLAG